MIETEWKRGWNHCGTTVKLGENEILFTKIWYTFESVFTQKWVSFWPFLHQKLYKICGWTRVKTSVKSPRRNSEAVRFLHCFDHNLCVFCTSCVPFLVILETIIGHLYPKLTIFGLRDERSEARWPWNGSETGTICTIFGYLRCLVYHFWSF